MFGYLQNLVLLAAVLWWPTLLYLFLKTEPRNRYRDDPIMYLIFAAGATVALAWLTFPFREEGPRHEVWELLLQLAKSLFLIAVAIPIWVVGIHTFFDDRKETRDRRKRTIFQVSRRLKNIRDDEAKLAELEPKMLAHDALKEEASTSEQVNQDKEATLNAKRSDMDGLLAHVSSSERTLTSLKAQLATANQELARPATLKRPLRTGYLTALGIDV